MRLLKMFLVACVLLVVTVVPSQVVADTVQNVHGTIRGHQPTRPPMTIWERMRDPRGWWQSRLVKSNQQDGNPRVRFSASGVQLFGEGAITNPIFFIPPTYGSGGKFARDIEVGDFNGDGKPDLLISNDCVSDTDCTQGTVAVLLGNGDGTYQPALIANTGTASASVAIGDFNRDGKLDLAVAGCPDIGCTSGSVNILLGNGDGTFRLPVAYSSGGGSFSVEAGDVNGDGKLDLVVVSGVNSAGVLLGNGDGTFRPISIFSTSSSGNSAVFLGDFNGDNKLDLAVVTNGCDATSTCTRSVGVLLGNGDGTFAAPVGNQSTVGLGAQAVALGDANGDGKLDLAVVDTCIPPTDTCANETIDVFLGNGNGTFKTAKSSPLVQSDVTFVGFGELNGDGKLDLATVDPSAASTSVLLGTGDGTFHPFGSYETEGRSPLFGVLGDLNGDGKTDIAIANACQVSFQEPCIGAAIVLLGNGGGTFAGPVSFPTGGSFQIAAADFNHDGRPDLALGSPCGNSDCTTGTVNVLLNNTNGTQPVSYDSGSDSLEGMAVATGDFNGDGNPDLVVANECVSQRDCTHGTIGVLLGKGDGTFHTVVTYSSGGAAPNSLGVGDFNGDGKLDLAVTQCSTVNGCVDGSNGSVGILLGNGDGSFRSAVTYPSGDPFAQGLAIGDFDGDGKLDLAVANGNCSQVDFGIICLTGSVGVLLGNGDGTFKAAVRYSSVDRRAFSLVTGDFNGDGKLDLAVGNDNCEDGGAPCPIGSIAVLLGNGDGTFGTAAIYPAGDPWPVNQITGSGSMALADLNGDGKLDLALTNRDVLLGNGDGTFQPAQSYNPAQEISLSEVVADFDVDGKPDLVVATPSQITILLNISTGFQHTTSTALTSSANPVEFHHHVTFTATITSTFQEAPTGTVTFSDRGHALASVSIANARAKFSTSSLDVGVHEITASYGGDETFLPSTSPALQQAVRADTRTRLTSSRNPSKRGQPVTFTAVVIANSGGTPVGTVTFKDFSTTLKKVQLSGGQATFTTSHLLKGAHVIHAKYSGSSTDERSSAVLAQRVR